MGELHTYLNFTTKATAIACFLSNSKGFQNGALSFLLTPSKLKFIGKMYVFCNIIQKVTTYVIVLGRKLGIRCKIQ